eukprot:scaffold228738_cov45-Tisochrysis_lutea.AAC.1
MSNNSVSINWGDFLQASRSANSAGVPLCTPPTLLCRAFHRATATTNYSPNPTCAERASKRRKADMVEIQGLRNAVAELDKGIS